MWVSWGTDHWQFYCSSLRSTNCWSRKPCFRYCNNIICTDCRISLALSEVAEKVEDEATVASAQPEVKEVEAPVVKSEYEDKAVAVVDDYVNVRKKPTTDSKAVGNYIRIT